jgi:hypothetical protein
MKKKLDIGHKLHVNNTHDAAHVNRAQGHTAPAIHHTANRLALHRVSKRGRDPQARLLSNHEGPRQSSHPTHFVNNIL